MTTIPFSPAQPCAGMRRALLALCGSALLGACATPPALPQAAPVDAPRAVVVEAPVIGATASAPPLAAPAAVPPEAASSGAASADPAPAAEAHDPLRPDVRIDLEDRSVHTDLWQRIRDGYAIADLNDEYVRSRERFYASRPDYVQRMTDRGTRYLFHIVEEVQRRGLPTELALLPFIESAFNPQALSSARASGIWQFMPATGRTFDLTQNFFRDDRRDVLASTRAALDYLTRLNGMFGDWHLALAAYNWGEGNVQRAIRRNERLGKPTDYASLKMPAETRDYVPKLQAVKNIVANPAAYGLVLPPLENHPYFLAVPIERDIDVALAARLADLPIDEFKALNPQSNKPVIVAAGTAQILLPYDNANTFVKALAAHAGPLASWTAWRASRTMKPAEAARLTGMSEHELRQVNAIPARMLVKAGSTLLVPRNGQRAGDVSDTLAENATLWLSPEAPPLRRVAFRVGKQGDSVAAIARRYRVSAQQVAQWNKVSPEARFPAGVLVVVYVPPKAAAKPGPRPRAASAARSTRTPRQR
ncbi:MAG TPA: transglycosylase SLT domain-containing protein [Burkholderiaceae bacterium]|nr:transglycosylase SLT domain-containing protein [Burkholderiaceae bacterium]